MKFQVFITIILIASLLFTLGVSDTSCDETQITTNGETINIGSSENDQGTSPHINTFISGCGNQEKETLDEIDAGNIRITEAGGYVRLHHSISYYCCAQLEVDWEQQGNTIKFIERNKGDTCKCTCTFGIDSTIGPFDSGDYHVKVYGVEHDDANAVLLGEKDISI